MKPTTPLTTLKAAMPATIAISILTAVAAGFSGCASGGGAPASRTHEMGPPKGNYRMSNQSMPDYPGR